MTHKGLLHIGQTFCADGKYHPHSAYPLRGLAPIFRSSRARFVTWNPSDFSTVAISFEDIERACTNKVRSLSRTGAVFVSI